MATPPRSLNPSNQPGTCFYCGRRLRFVKQTLTDDGVNSRTIPVGQRPNLYDKPGYYGNGFFCNKGCGYSFGLIAATKGVRYKLTEH